MYNKAYNILIVEDEFVNAQFVEQMLTALGHTVVGNVKNSASAIAITKNNVTIDLIFMDINLEGNEDGILCSKKINRDREIPIIYISAFVDSETLEEVMETNVYGFLTKPFDGKDIETALLVAIKQIKIKNNKRGRTNILNLGNNYIYEYATRTFMIKKTPISLTKKELDTLDILCKNINQNISYDALANYVWSGREITISTVRDTVLRLRKKAPLLNINNISGFGYCLQN